MKAAIMYMNPATIANLIVAEFNNYSPGVPSNKEYRIVVILKKIILESCYNSSFDITAYESLDIDDKWLAREFEKAVIDDEEIPENEESTWKSIANEEKDRALDYYHSTTSGKRSLPSMHSRFRWITTDIDIKHLLRLVFI
jgi:hypothetical protein